MRFIAILLLPWLCRVAGNPGPTRLGEVLLKAQLMVTALNPRPDTSGLIYLMSKACLLNLVNVGKLKVAIDSQHFNSKLGQFFM